MSLLQLKAVGHVFLGRAVLENVSLDVEQGEMVALVGPSGCGKSTLAQIAAGLIAPRHGQIVRNYDRCAFVFQEPRLLPWATVETNVALGLSGLSLSRAEQRTRIAAACHRVSLEESDWRKFPSQLSGGMRQRTALARALVGNPDFLYFDEPFTALDAALRRRMQDLVVSTVSDSGKGGLFITHDIHEALRICHRIAVLDRSGHGILDCVAVPEAPGNRSDKMIFETARRLISDHPLFAVVDEHDERRLA
ncbi:ABC transporter ATP-binding protein [Peteryoungia ipomoeae]|uniref:ATP-binding cassette domain-containing protein n=1 Tax=Peteryoungia ipomoeae TaxID=1210932 RepID=A0A4V4HLZ4_9HYPH|nr:ATP-binding cassette domain-containing protein [Peteryoungia ipomoeae]THV20176.1 ATP-binding cassette domain-containing protein [Peteryoungia ipomoeae]